MFFPVNFGWQCFKVFDFKFNPLLSNPPETSGRGLNGLALVLRARKRRESRFL